MLDYEQRAVLKFCFLLAKKGTVMLQTTFKEYALGKIKVCEWFSRFKKGERAMADQLRS